MAQLTPAQIAYYAQQAGFSGLGLINAVAVAMAESTGVTDATHVNTEATGIYQGSIDQGLWQINNVAHPQYAGASIFDPLTNAQAAFAISQGGTNFGAWTTWIQGTYKNFLTQVNNAIGTIAGINPGGSTGIEGINPGGTIGSGGINPGGSTGIEGINPSGTIQGIIPPAVTQTFTDAIGALGSLANSLGTGVNDLTTGISDLRAVGDFLQTPALWTRVAVGVLGAILLVVGLILFAASFMPKGTQLPIPVPV